MHLTVPETLGMSVIERIDDAVALLAVSDDGPHFVHANPAFAAVTSYAAEQLIGATPELLWPPHSGREALHRLHDAVRRGECWVGEAANRRGDGVDALLHWRVEPLQAAASDQRYVLAVVSDVTERRHAERRQRDLETLARVHAEVTEGGLDLDTVRRRIAAAALSITEADGAVVEEPEGREMVYRAGAGRAEASEGLRLAIDGSLSGLCYRTLEVLVCADTATDERVDQQASLAVGFRSGVMVPLVKGYRCYGVLKVFSDQPQRFNDTHAALLKLVSQVLASALQQAQSHQAEVSRRRSLVDALPMLVAYVDRDEHYREVNAAYGRWFGVPTERIQGRRIEDVMGAERYDVVRPYVHAALRGEQVAFEISMTLAPDTGLRHLAGELTPDNDAEGRVRGFFSVVRDVTEARAAHSDYLTGLNTRRRFEEQGAALLESARRYQRPVSLVLLDVDHFKTINDSHGHAIGDEVLKALAAILQRELRSADLPARWGGEEFAIVVPETDEASAAVLAERVREALARAPFDGVGSVTASFGVAGMSGADDLGTLQRRADAALYRAKRLGRDRVVRATEVASVG